MVDRRSLALAYNSRIHATSLKHEVHNETPWYRFTADGTCINTKTGRRIKQTMCGRSIGYCINGRFMALNTLRPMLRKIEHINCPF